MTTDPFSSRVKVIYLGEKSDCKLSTAPWIIDEVVTTNNEECEFLATIAEASVKDVSMKQLMKLNMKYLKTFPVYNTLVNCQHYAVNLFNLLSKRALDYQASDVMGDHSDASGSQTATTVRFGLEFEPESAARLSRLRKSQRGHKK